VAWLLSFLILPPDGAAAGSGPAGGAEGAVTLPKPAFDYKGAVIFAASMGSALLAVNRGNDLGWGSAFILSLAVLAAVLAVVLWQVERRAANPIIPGFLFTDRVICVANLVPMPAGMA
jgi:hypothetical protein